MERPGQAQLQWRCRDRLFSLGKRTLIMGVLNVTPDSFSDGGAYIDPDRAIRRAFEMLDEGADIIDVGGESSRPGSERVSLAEELRRVIPVVSALAQAGRGAISVDTMKADVARRSLDAGAHIINDITGLTHDPAMVEVVRAAGAGVVIMHMQGEPRTMQLRPAYADVTREVVAYLRDRLAVAVRHGVDATSVALDPGIGFGKTVEHNLQLLRDLPLLLELGRPILVGISRKSFLGAITGRENPSDRLASGVAAMAVARMNGAHIVRVHDVKEACDGARVVDRITRVEA